MAGCLATPLADVRGAINDVAKINTAQLGATLKGDGGGGLVGEG